MAVDGSIRIEAHIETAKLKSEVQDLYRQLDSVAKKIAETERSQASTKGSIRQAMLSKQMLQLKQEEASIREQIAAREGQIATQEAAEEEAAAGRKRAAWEQARGALRTASDATASMAQGMLSGMRTILGAAAEMGRGIQTSMMSAARAAVRGLSNVLRSISSFVKSARAKLAQVGNSVGTVLKSLSRLVLGASVFSLISRAMQSMTANIGDVFKEYLNHDANLKASIEGLKLAFANLSGAFVSAFAPILSFVIPIISQLVNWISMAINAIGQFFGLLGGSRSYKTLVANNKAATSAINKTGAAAKKAEQNLASWDELNVLSKKEDSGGGGGGGDAGPQFTEVENPIKDLDLKDLLAKFKDFLKNIPWDEIQQAAYDLGKKFAEILNTIFADEELAALLGKTIAEVLNTALFFALGFLETFDWTQFGRWAGILWNAFVMNFRWDILARDIELAGNGIVAALLSFFQTIQSTAYFLGQGLAEVFNAIFVGIDFSKISQVIMQAIVDLNIALYGFITGVDWDGVTRNLVQACNVLAHGMLFDGNGYLHDVWSENGQIVGRAISQFVDVIYDIIGGINWHAFGESIGRWLQSAFEEIDWSEALGVLIRLKTALFETLTGIIEGIDWRAVADLLIQELGDFITSGDLEGLATSIAEFIGAAVGAAATLVEEVLIDLADAIWGYFDQYISEEDWAAGGLAVIEGFLQGCWDAIKSIGTWVYDNIVKPFLDAFRDNFDMHSPSKVMAELGQDVINGLLNGLTETWALITEWLGTVIEELLAWLAEKWEAISTFFSEAWETLSSWFQEKWEEFKTSLDEGLAAIQEAWETVWQAVSDFFTTIWTAITVLLPQKIAEIKKEITDKLAEIQKNWNEKWQAIHDKVIEIVGWIHDKLAEKWDAIQEKLGNVLDAVKEKWDTAWGGMRDTLKGIVNSIIGFINRMISAVAEGINSIIDTLNALSFDIPDWVPKWGGESFGINLSRVSAPQIPLLADGAVIRGGNPFAAILGDQPAGQTNIEAPLSTITEAVRSALQAESAGGVNTVVINIDGELAGELLLDPMIGAIQRRGLTADGVFGTV